MEILLSLYYVLYFVPGILVAIEFILFLITGKRKLNKVVFAISEFACIVILPTLFAAALDIGNKNDCCDMNAYFSPDHRLTIYALILFCIGFYFYSRYRKQLATPIIEIITNCFLLIGVVLNIAIAIHVGGLGIFGNIPIIMLFILMLITNHDLFIENVSEYSFDNKSALTKIALRILTLRPIRKFPILLVLSLPILMIIAGVLLLFGQKPDSIIKAFTDTYNHGLSAPKEPCECGDQHFLCTIAAKGHGGIVKPTRFGIRHGYQIKVNRQLLVSNAFEELLQEKLPAAHKRIRQIYNFIGGNFRKLYNILGNKWISDFVYFAMKPLELLFITTLYIFDKKPEDRIEKQYIRTDDRKQLENKVSFTINVAAN